MASPPDYPSPAAVAAGHLALAATALLVADLLARAGRAPDRWLRAGKTGGLEAVATRWFLGVVVFGSALLGLATTGLFTRSTVILSLPLLAVAARMARPAASPLYAIVKTVRPSSPVGAAAALVALLPVVARLVSPHYDHDSMIYHLGYPSQCLAVHQAPIGHLSLAFQFPLLTDLTHALPIALGDDRLAKWTGAGALVGASAIAAARYPGFGWLFVLLALSPRSLTWLAALTKNDLAAAGLLVAGALHWRGGSRTVAAVLFGGSVAAKPTGAPLILVWIVMHLTNRHAGRAGRSGAVAGAPRTVDGPHLEAASSSSRTASSSLSVSSFLSVLPAWKLLLLYLLLFSAPLLPWLAKSWIATGDPAFPWLWKAFPGPFWSAANQASADLQHIWIAPAGRLATLPVTWLRSLWEDYPLQFAALPLLVFASRARPALAAGAGAMAVLYLGRISRYMVPGAWLISIELAALTAVIPGRRGERLRLALAVAALVLVARWPETRTAPWRTVLAPVETARREGLTGWGDAARDLADIAPRRVLAVGTDRVYPVTSRVVYNGFLGEIPLTWTLAREARDADHLRSKFRQLGATMVLFNVVSSEWMASFQEPFPWTDRMLGVYHAFARNRITPRTPPRRVDREAGGYWLLALNASPNPPMNPSPLLFLPGTEASQVPGRRLRDVRDFPASEAEFRRLLAVTPGVDALESQLGYTFAEAGRWKDAYRVLAPLDAHGYIDTSNLWGHGCAAIWGGRYDEAERILNRAIAIYDTKHANRTNLAWCHQARADALINRGRTREAIGWLDQAEATLARVPDTPGTYWATARRQIVALVIGSRADLARLSGRHADAGRLYGEAAALGHDLPEAKRWSEATR